MKGNLIEVFSGIQGEGPIVGYRQVFVRFGGCNLGCAYCDTLSGPAPAGTFRAEATPGLRDFMTFNNPVPSGDLLDLVRRLNPAIHHSVSLTGGEPLLQAEFIRSLAPGLKDLGLKVYLETNGSLPGELERVIDCVDLIGMDFKLPSITQGPPLIDEHTRFLTVAACREVFVKMVVGETTADEEIGSACSVIAAVDRHIPVVLQPVTPYGKIPRSISPGRVLRLQEICLAQLKDVRVIPQTHKMMGQL